MLHDKTILGVSAQLADHIAALDFAVLPDRTVAATRRSLLDTIGVMLGASGLAEEALSYRRHALDGGAGPSRLIGLNARVAPAAAALANGALARRIRVPRSYRRCSRSPIWIRRSTPARCSRR
jgi:2-methylcitrate dehydratase PrpD